MPARSLFTATVARKPPWRSGCHERPKVSSLWRLSLADAVEALGSCGGRISEHPESAVAGDQRKGDPACRCQRCLVVEPVISGVERLQQRTEPVAIPSWSEES